MNNQLDPDCSPANIPRRPATVLRLTAENPLEAIIARLQQFTSTTLAGKLVKRRAEADNTEVPAETVDTKATGISYLMRGALDYVVSTPRDALNRRVLGLYYGTMALAQAEMLASPSGPADLDAVEGMTRKGHGLYALPIPHGGFAEIRVGVRATGFFPEWMRFLGYDITEYPKKWPKSEAELAKVPASMVCSLRDLFASMPEIDDLFAEVFGGPPGWVSVGYDTSTNVERRALTPTAKKRGSSYCLFIDRSGKVSSEILERAGWPLAEIRQAENHEGPGTAFRARVDHVGHDHWWMVLPTYSSPFRSGSTLVFPTVGCIQEYRTIAAVILYALSIMVRYLPSTWRRVEGGDEDQYLALVQAALAVWERLLPEHFLTSIAGENVRTAQPGSLFA